jgi:hypothetical protein
MDEEFKVFLTKGDITVDEYKRGSLEAKTKLLEIFEKSKAQGKLSVQSLIVCIYILFF